MFYAYIDESYVGLPNNRYFMVVAGVITPDPRALGIQCQRIKKRTRVEKRSDVHAAATPDTGMCQ